MPTNPHALARLEVLVGEWVEHFGIPGVPDGRMAVERILGGQGLTQTSEVPHPDVPDSLTVPDPDSTRFVQHYFDSRGVVRTYHMDFDGVTWRLQRDEADFSPLSFHQRYIGTVSADGDTIRGAWETSPDGVSWELDLHLDHTRVR